MAHIPTSLLNQMLPRVATWAEKQEQLILEDADSRALSSQELEIARRAGVLSPEAVRILALPEIPLPEETNLRAAAMAVGLGAMGGLTLGHGIFIRNDHANDGKLVAHELRHVAQYERYESILGFLQRFLFEVNEYRYPETPMEQEAVVFAETIFPEL